MRLRLFVVLLLPMWLFGCMGGVRVTGTVVKKPHAQFGISPLSESWHQKKFRGAELFFEHKDHDATIFLNSECEKFSDSPLEALTSQLLVGMSNIEITSQRRVSLNDREALISEITVNLDGVYRYLKIMVLRKNRCVFDAILSAPSYREALVKDFDDMTASFWAEADL